MRDIFVAGGRSFRVEEVDRYGRFVAVAETKRGDETFYVYDGPTGQTGRLHSDFWKLKLTTIDGRTIRMADLRGRPLLLTVWGEWCLPCRKAIPDLVAARQAFGDKLEIVGFLASANLGKARELIRSTGMTWPQIPLSKVLERKLRVVAYPTDILLLADGNGYVRMPKVTADSLGRYVNAPVSRSR